MKDAAEALRRKQDKEREAAGLPPVTRGGGRGGQPARGARGLPNGRGGGGRGATPTRAVGPRGGGTFTKPRPGGGGHDRNLWVHLVGLLRQRQLLPAVIFTFSKKRCEENAGSMPNTDLCTALEKSEIHVVIERSLTRLKGVSVFATRADVAGSDRSLPQIRRMRDLLSRGVAVHHGGLLPIVKEVRAARHDAD